MNFNRFALTRTALGLCSAMLILSAPAARAQQSGPVMSSSIINFAAREELRASDAASILATRLQLRDGVDELRSAYIENPGSGLQVQRFHQYFKGLRVSHGSFSVTSKNGMASFAFGKHFPVPANLSITPAIDEKTALANAMKEIGASKWNWDFDPSEYPKGELQLCEDFKSGEEPNGEVRLAWVFDVHAVEPLSGNKMYIDAQTGKLLLADAIIKHVAASGASLYSGTVNFEATLSGGTYRLEDASRGGGVQTLNLAGGTVLSTGIPVTSTTSSFARDPAVDAHWGATEVYDYWKTQHGRLSWNGRDGILRSYVHYGTGYNNAFWNGSSMIYGDGTGTPPGFSPLTSLDVCAHEFGHGVCQATAQLIYNRESGAMNEGFSDIWGAVIEQFGDPKETDAVAKDMWLIGEELGNTMRSMREPKLHSQPDTYQGLLWQNANATTCNSTLNDNCGVHYNSGVLNHWFYLLTEGGSGTNDLNNYFKVPGIGVVSAAKIAYATELALNPSANYASARTASIAATATLFGACSRELEAVTRAWYAVGVGDDYNAACAPQIAFEAGVTTTISEDISVNGCKPSRLVSVPVVLRGTTGLTGDSATVKAVVVGGNAVAGVDYTLSVDSATFRIGGSVSGNIGITVYDNGYVNADKYIDLKLSLVARGSNATLGVIGDSIRVTIAENERDLELGGPQSYDVLTITGNSNVITPFSGSAQGARAQYIYRPFELVAAGLRPNEPITSLDFNVTGAFSTQPYNNYTVKLANSANGSLNNGWITSGLTTVYSGNYTVMTGWSNIPFSTPFVWNGQDNILVEICFDGTSAGASMNDRVAVSNGPQFLAAYNSSTTSGGCALPFRASNLIGQRPLISFTQQIPGAAIESAANATRTWDVPAGKQVHFVSDANKKLMTSITAGTDSLGCVTTTVSATGNGFRAMGASLVVSRSQKEYTIAQSGAQRPAVNFGGTLFFTDAEIGSADVSKIRIMHTTATTDAAIDASNSRVIPVTQVYTGAGFKGFSGNFSAFGRYFVIDSAQALNVGSTAPKAGELWTGENPFNSYPVLHWNLSRSEQVSIRLMDITGKLVYSTDARLDAGSSKLELRASNTLAPGAYVLQVIRPGAVFTRQMIRK